MMEDKSNKRKISDTLRLESIKRRKSEKAAQVKLISRALNNVDSLNLKNKKIVFDSGIDDDPQVTTVKISKNGHDDKVPLFNSSDSEGDEDYGHQFKSKIQYEGERGAQLFQENLECTDERFKRDETFHENDDGSSYFTSNQEALHKDIDETELEKNKNFEILEQVLGTTVRKPHFNESVKNKKKTYVRFDPESEDAANYIRKQEIKQKDEKKEVKKTGEEDFAENKEPVVSKERFFEVASNLKDLLNNSEEKFNLGNKFKLLGDAEEQLSLPSQSPEKLERSFDTSSNYNTQTTHKVNSFLKGNKDKETNSSTLAGCTKSRKTFFMQPNDDRQKEGLDFFRRTVSLDTVREQWPTIRNNLIGIYKNGRKMGMKPTKPRPKGFQNQKRHFK